MYTLNELNRAMHASWGPDTASVPSEWSSTNPARGQCVPTALLIQEYLGGDLQKLETSFKGKTEAHYRNVLSSGQVVDLTRSQYPKNQVLEVVSVNLKGFSSIREKRLAAAETRARYEILLHRVKQHLAA